MTKKEKILQAKTNFKPGWKLIEISLPIWPRNPWQLIWCVWGLDVWVHKIPLIKTTAVVAYLLLKG